MSVKSNLSPNSKNLKKDVPTEIISIPLKIGNLPYISLYALCIISSSEGPSTSIALSNNNTRNVSYPETALKYFSVSLLKFVILELFLFDRSIKFSKPNLFKTKLL